MMFDSHHPLIHKLGVIRTLFHRADNIPSTEESKSREREHLKSALKICGYQNWTFEKALKPREKSVTTSSTSSTIASKRRNNITIPYVAGVSEKLKRIFGKHQIPASFKPCNTLRQRLVHLKGKPPRHKQSNIVYTIQCQDSECKEFYIGKQNNRCTSACTNTEDLALLVSMTQLFRLTSKQQTTLLRTRT